MRYLLFFMVFAFGLLSCQEEAGEWGGKTGFQISLNEVSAEVMTKAASEDFRLRVTRDGSDTPTYEGTLSEGGETFVPVAVGRYGIVATSGDNLDTDVYVSIHPYYVADTTGVEISQENERKSIQLTARHGAALASVIFPDEAEMKKIFKEYAVRVKVGNASALLRSPEDKVYFRKDTPVAFYFEATKLSGERIEGKQLSDPNLPTSFAAADYCVITLKLNDALSLDIQTVAVNQVTVEETIPLDWLPKPKLEAKGFTDNALSFVETETAEAKVRFNLASDLQDIRFRFTFEDERFANLNRDTGYLYSNPEDWKLISETLGVALADNQLDLQGLIAQLHTNAGTATANKVEVDVRANNRWSSEDTQANRVYTLTCQKPVFRIDAYPGNIWTKEFTVNALRSEQVESGDFGKLGAEMSYQYSADGSQWTTIAEDLRQTGLSPNTEYYIRGLYRGEVPGEAVKIKTYPEIALENGDMEDWAYERTDDARNPITKNLDYVYWKKWFPWTSVATPSIWNTVNQTTTQDGAAPTKFLGLPTPPYVGCCYVANSGTIPTTDSRSGQAALIRTVGWGSGNTAEGERSTVKRITPGELYLGTYDLASHQPVYGIEYASRPTAVRFWCKYEPKSTDKLIAQIVVLDKDGATIGSATLPEAETGAMGWDEKTLTLQYSDPMKEPAKMYILFKSGTLTDSGIMDLPTFGNLSDAESVGSKLYIDNVELVYGK